MMTGSMCDLRLVARRDREKVDSPHGAIAAGELQQIATGDGLGGEDRDIEPLSPSVSHDGEAPVRRWRQGAVDKVQGSGGDDAGRDGIGLGLHFWELVRRGRRRPCAPMRRRAWHHSPIARDEHHGAPQFGDGARARCDREGQAAATAATLSAGTAHVAGRTVGEEGDGAVDGWQLMETRGTPTVSRRGGGWGDVALIAWAPPPEAGGTSPRTVVSGHGKGEKGGP